MKKEKIILYTCTIVFTVISIYLIFFSDNTKKYDSKTEAYNIVDDSNDNTYNPIYFYIVDGKEYTCTSKVGSSKKSDKKKNMVYYDSKNPENCITEYEKSTNKFAGYMFLLLTAGMIFFIKLKPVTSKNENNIPENVSDMENYNFTEDKYNIVEKINKIEKIDNTINSIIKKVIIGIIVLVLIVFTFIDSLLLKQTIKARNYERTNATYTNSKDDFNDRIYVFKDNEGKEHKTYLPSLENSKPKILVKVKYNINDPEENYNENELLSTSQIIFYIIKIIAIIILLMILFNKNPINILKSKLKTNNNY